MKRDMELILLILKYVEENGNGKSLRCPTFENYDADQTKYHIGLCIEAGFLNGEKSQSMSHGTTYIVFSLTWEGHQKLESMRD